MSSVVVLTARIGLHLVSGNHTCISSGAFHSQRCSQSLINGIDHAGIEVRLLLARNGSRPFSA